MKETKPRVITGWHILHSDGLCMHDHRIPLINAWERAVETCLGWRVDTKITLMCNVGMHACIELADAFMYRHPDEGVYICRVKVKGDIKASNDKIVGLYRKILWYVKLSKEEAVALYRLAHVSDGSDDDINAGVENFVMQLPKDRRQTSPIQKRPTKYQEPRVQLLKVKNNGAKLCSGTKLHVDMEYGHGPFPYVVKSIENLIGKKPWGAF